jgi:hypothetical protein
VARNLNATSNLAVEGGVMSELGISRVKSETGSSYMSTVDGYHSSLAQKWKYNVDFYG